MKKIYIIVSKIEMGQRILKNGEREKSQIILVDDSLRLSYSSRETKLRIMTRFFLNIAKLYKCLSVRRHDFSENYSWDLIQYIAFHERLGRIQFYHVVLKKYLNMILNKSLLLIDRIWVSLMINYFLWYR